MFQSPIDYGPWQSESSTCGSRTWRVAQIEGVAGGKKELWTTKKLWKSEGWNLWGGERLWEAVCVGWSTDGLEPECLDLINPDCHLLAVWPRAAYFTSLKWRPLLSESTVPYLNFLWTIFKMKGLLCVKCFHSFTLIKYKFSELV